VVSSCWRGDPVGMDRRGHAGNSVDRLRIPLASEARPRKPELTSSCSGASQFQRHIKPQRTCLYYPGGRHTQERIQTAYRASPQTCA